jgi:hypothetical protein
VELPGPDWFFGEGPGGVIVSGAREGLERLGAKVLGEVAGETLEISSSAATLAMPVELARTAFTSAIPDLFQ